MTGNRRTGDGPATWRERLQMLRFVPWFVRIVWESGRMLFLTSISLRVIAAFVPISLLWISKLIVDIVVRSLSQGISVPNGFWWLVGTECILALAGDTVARLTSLVDSLLADRFTDESTIRIMRHAATLDLSSFEDPAFYDRLERARRQTSSRLGMIASLFTMIQQLVVLATLLSAVVLYYPWLLGLLLCAMVPVFLGETKSAMLRYSMLYGFTPERRQLEYLSYLGTSAATAKEVKLFGLSEYLISRTARLFRSFYDTNKVLAMKRSAVGAALNVIPVCAYYGAYVLIIARTVHGHASVGDLTLVIGAYSRARSIMEAIVTGLISVSEQAMFVKDIHDFLATAPRIISGPASRRIPRPIVIGIEFCDVSFSYPGGTSPVLTHVSFAIAPGERIALVGENGAGKTTLIKLLSRLYDPTEGRILLDGIDLREYDIEDLRTEIGVIFQDYVRYDMPVRENIGFGRINELSNREAIERAARLGRAQSLIESLPGEYDQMLGRRFDSGVDLSIGQWQKLALARAYMRDAQLMILDEPTASVDARAEAEIYEHFASLTRTKMAVLISHRFSTVRIADRILVMERGTITECGSHEELLEAHGRYAELFELQANGYR